jgi:hypothetical protein
MKEKFSTTESTTPDEAIEELIGLNKAGKIKGLSIVVLDNKHNAYHYYHHKKSFMTLTGAIQAFLFDMNHEATETNKE